MSRRNFKAWDMFSSKPTEQNLKSQVSLKMLNTVPSHSLINNCLTYKSDCSTASHGALFSAKESDSRELLTPASPRKTIISKDTKYQEVFIILSVLFFKDFSYKYAKNRFMIIKLQLLGGPLSSVPTFHR